MPGLVLEAPRQRCDYGAFAPEPVPIGTDAYARGGARCGWWWLTSAWVRPRGGS